MTAAVETRLAAPTRSEGPCRARLTDGRWHFQHGPIDLIIGAEGAPAAISIAVERAWSCFQGVLTGLVSELRVLRSAVHDDMVVQGPVARRMLAACRPHSAAFITPMAAVAGAVADEMIEAFRTEPDVRRAFVNNGGDIALHLREGERYRIALFADLGRIERRERWRLDGDFDIECGMPVRGVATSGWRGRSFSLGIADSVTVLARDAAQADAAATMVANAVDIDSPSIVRLPANELKDDSDLGALPVTVEVGTLTPAQVEAALENGADAARRLCDRGLTAGAVLMLRGRTRVVGELLSSIPFGSRGVENH